MHHRQQGQATSQRRPGSLSRVVAQKTGRQPGFFFVPLKYGSRFWGSVSQIFHGTESMLMLI